MKRSAAVALVLGAAALAAVVGAAAPFTGQALGAVGSAAGTVLDGSPASAATSAVSPTVHAAPAVKRAPATATATALPPMPDINGATHSMLVNCSQQTCTSGAGAGPNDSTCGAIVGNRQFCVWGTSAPTSWSCTIMEMSGTPSGPLDIRASLYSGYAESVTVNFSDNQQGHIFPSVTYPVSETGPYTLWEPVPPGDIGASAEPSACTAS